VGVVGEEQKANIKQRIQITREFIEEYVKKNIKVDGVILVGSTNIGINDQYSDFDIIVIATLEAVLERKAEGKGYNETYVYKYMEIYIDWHSLKELRSELNN
jgi:predicted nucleotidyltransferase